MLDLADTYCILAQYGDGDGAWAAKCIEILDQFAKDYPDDPEMSWVRKTRMKIDEIILERLYGCAVYNHRIGRDDTARTYLVEIIHNYGDREEAKKAEELLSQIDRSYTPPPENYPRKPAEKFPYERSQIPTENSPIMIVPENSGGKWLLPVRDLKSDVRIDSSKKIPERTFSDDEI